MKGKEVARQQTVTIADVESKVPVLVHSGNRIVTIRPISAIVGLKQGELVITRTYPRKAVDFGKGKGKVVAKKPIGKPVMKGGSGKK